MTHTKGSVIVEQINIGDTHYEYEFGLGIKMTVLTKPILNEDGNWTWKSKNVNSNAEIDYLVNPEDPHYSANLYDYEAYKVKFYI